ncbi:adenine phosphoribosyltransferase [Corynebacterium pyruviciproducens]
MAFTTAREALDALTRHVPGFPAEGVVFEDLTPVFADADAFRLVIDELAQFCKQLDGEVVAGLDARGFLVGSAVAYSLGQGCLAVRKKGKLPPPVITEEYTLEYGTAALEIPAEGIDIKGKRVVLIDDVLATGGTLTAATDLIRRGGGEVVGYVVILEVDGLGGREKLGDAPLLVLSHDGE